MHSDHSSPNRYNPAIRGWVNTKAAGRCSPAPAQHFLMVQPHRHTRPGPPHPVLAIRDDAEEPSIGAVHDPFVREDDAGPSPGPSQEKVSRQW